MYPPEARKRVKSIHVSRLQTAVLSCRRNLERCPSQGGLRKVDVGATIDMVDDLYNNSQCHTGSTEWKAVDRGIASLKVK